MDQFARIRNLPLLLDGILLTILLAAWLRPSAGYRTFRTLEKFGARLASRKWLAIFVAGISPILLRVGLMRWFPAPVPGVHDEFSYLLAADTFAHGRLTNPSHPMWIFFETFHVNMQPTYMSKYQPGQGAALALGQLLGHPWIGVLLSVGAMCAAIVWALQGWFPRRWALLGGAFAAIQFGIFNYWNDSYWGGAVAAIGGTLIVGALPRIFRHLRARDALLFGTGAAILANSRPWEGAVFFATAAIVLAAWIYRRRDRERSTIFRRVVAPLALVLISTGVFMGYYNWRLTGDPLLFPYRLNDRSYMVTPNFVWQRLGAPREYSNAEFDSFYNDWTREIWKDNHLDASWRGLQNGLFSKLEQLREFYLPDYLCVPVILTLPWLWRDPKMRVLALLAGACVLSVLGVVWFEPHYGAPMTAALFGIVVQAMRHLRQWRFRGRPVGIGVSRAVALFAIALVPVNAWLSLCAKPRDANEEHMAHRTLFASQLEKLPGNQLVIVRYSAEHDPGEEWVYNRADIDGAKIVWAREKTDVGVETLLNYFQGRRAWLLEADTEPPRLSAYPAPSPHR